MDRLEEAVNEDTDAIAMVSDTANETISAAANLTSRLMAIRVSVQVHVCWETLRLNEQ